MSKSVKFFSRGLGSESGLPCFATGAPDDGSFKTNIAAFVNSAEDALRVLAMIGGRGRVTWDPPYDATPMKHIQVKIGVLDGHDYVLQMLDHLTRQAGNVITPEIVIQALAAKPAVMHVVSQHAIVPPGMQPA